MEWGGVGVEVGQLAGSHVALLIPNRIQIPLFVFTAYLKNACDWHSYPALKGEES